MKRCSSLGCRKKRGLRKKHCPKHASQAYRAANPIKAAYDTLKMNAKRRGKIFTITLAYWKKLILDTGYIEKKGRLKDSLHIHRKEEEKGYIPGNLEVITNEMNHKAYQDWLKNRKMEENDIITHAEIDAF